MTEPAIDLAAVARARTELARVVANNPHLTSPEAQERLATALPALVESPMPPRLTPESAESTIVGVRMTDEMLRALDVEVAQQRAANPDLPITRSTVLRGIVRRALLSPAEPSVVPAEVSVARRPSVPPPRASSPPSRPSAPPPRASVRPPVDLVVPASPRVPAELVDVAQVPANDPRQLSLIEEAPPPPHAPNMDEIRARIVAIKAAGETFKTLGAKAGVAHGTVHKFASGGSVSETTLAALARYVEAHG